MDGQMATANYVRADISLAYVRADARIGHPSQRLSMSPATIPGPNPDPDADLIAVCLHFRRRLLAYQTALRAIARIKPSDVTISQARLLDQRADAIYHVVQAASRVIQSMPAIGPSGRTAKIIALNTYVKVMPRPDGDLIELDLAISIIGDFVGARSSIN